MRDKNIPSEIERAKNVAGNVEHMLELTVDV